MGMHLFFQMEATQVPVNRQVDGKKLWYIYVMEYYTAIKTNDILAFATAPANLESILF